MINSGIFKVVLFITTLLLSADPSVAQQEIILKKHSAPVKAVAFSPDGRLLVSGGEDRMICFWDVAEAEFLSEIKTSFTVKALLFTDNEHFLAACGDDIVLMDLSGKILRTFSGYTTDVWSISYNEKAGKIAAGSYAKTIKVWDFNTAKPVLALQGHERSCLPVEFSPDGNVLVSGSLDKTVKLWDASTGAQIGSQDIHSENIFSVDYHPSGKYFITSSADKTIRLWDAEKKKVIRTFIGHEGAVYDARFSIDGHHILSCDSKNAVILWEAATGKRIWTYTGHRAAVNSVCFNGDGAFATASDDNTVTFWRSDKKILLAGSYFEKEIEKTVTESPLFRPKDTNESRQEYAERTIRADRTLDSLYSVYYLQYVETLNKLAAE